MVIAMAILKVEQILCRRLPLLDDERRVVGLRTTVLTNGMDEIQVILCSDYSVSEAQRT